MFRWIIGNIRNVLNRSRLPDSQAPESLDGRARDELIRKFGTTGVERVVHRHCFAMLLIETERGGNAVQPDRVGCWKSEELIGRSTVGLVDGRPTRVYVKSCDECGGDFSPGGEDLISCWVTSEEELSACLRIRGEQVTAQADKWECLMCGRNCERDGIDFLCRNCNVVYKGFAHRALRG
jgi:hypothetical protein